MIHSALKKYNNVYLFVKSGIPSLLKSHKSSKYNPKIVRMFSKKLCFLAFEEINVTLLQMALFLRNYNILRLLTLFSTEDQLSITQPQLVGLTIMIDFDFSAVAHSHLKIGIS